MFANSFSPADYFAMSGNNFGCGGGSVIWLLVIFALLFGWNNGGMFGRGGGGSAMDGYILTSDFSNIERKIDGVNNGICSLGYDQLAQMNGINQNILTNGYALQQAINGVNVNASNNARDISEQLANCCCENQKTAMQAQYNLATESCQTRQAIADAKSEIIGFLTQDKIASLQAENQNLKFCQSRQAQNAYLLGKLMPAPVPAFNVGYNPYNYNMYGTTIA